MNKQPEPLTTVDELFDEIEMDPLEDISDKIAAADAEDMKEVESIFEWVIEVDDKKASLEEGPASAQKSVNELVEQVKSEPSITKLNFDSSASNKLAEHQRTLSPDSLMDKVWVSDDRAQKPVPAEIEI